jgi:ubiquinol-cytochrome c reductase cytochrome c subunit
VRIPYLAAALSLVYAIQLPGQDAANGKKLFTKDGCYQCHGTQGQGTTAGARLAPKPLALAALIAYVRQPKGQMPPYTARVISDVELSDIRAYLASISEPPPAKNIPLLNQ